MKSAQEIIEISSDEEEGIGLKIPEETRAHSCGKRKRKYGVGNEFPPGAPLDVPEDDDCLILDGVPESVASGSEYAELGAEMLDEMLIVGEKGQVIADGIFRNGIKRFFCCYIPQLVCFGGELHCLP